MRCSNWWTPESKWSIIDRIVGERHRALVETGIDIGAST